MKNLHISKEISVPVDIATQKLAWLGTTGSGKTYGASKLAEEFWHAGAQFVVLDPVGVWYGLRLAKDGKNPSKIDIPVFGGLHGDIPLSPESGKLIANLIVDKTLSVILDVSQFESDAAKARFAADFADQFFFRKKAAASAVHLFIEECQEFVPQNLQRGEERMLHAFVRMQKLGRNFGIGSSLISQRPQEVNKKALNMAQTLFVFRNTGTHERNAIEKWIEDKSLDQRIAQDLPKIPTGQCHIWSPEFLKISEMVHILEKETFNASATPEVGQKAKAASLSSIDVEALRADMAEVVIEAAKNDPRALQREIATLKKALVGKNGTVIEKQVVDPKVTQRAVEAALLSNDRKWRIEGEKMKKEFVTLVSLLTKIKGMIPDTFANFSVLPSVREVVSAFTVTPQNVSMVMSDLKNSLSTGDDATLVVPTGESLTGPEQKILNAIAWCESIGNMQPPQELVAFLSGYSHMRSTGYTNPRGYLKTKGLVEYGNGTVSLTEEGRKLADTPDTILTQEELHRIVLNKLNGPERKVLTPLLKAYPEGMSNTELCAATGYEHERSTGYTNPRAKLNAYGLIEYQNGKVRAKDLLFI